jgi:hypothetical protein
VGEEVKINRGGGHRSLFWPFLFIGVGVIWLLANLGVLSAANLAVLVRLWPLLLIVVGLDMLFGRGSPAISALIGLGAVGVAIALMLIGPSLGWSSGMEVQTSTFSEPKEDATSARVDLNLSVGDTAVTALSDSSNLFEATLTHVGEIEFVAQGESEKFISLSPAGEGISLGFLDWLINPDTLRWDIGLSPDVPLDLTVSGGVGKAQLDMSELRLTSLTVNGGVGELNLSLPATDALYSARIKGGVGGINIVVAENAALRLDIEGGVGGITVDVPDDAPVRVESSGGLGALRLPDNFERISSDPDDDDEGVWEIPGFTEASRQIVVTYNGGVGGLTIR